jgi:hypothetical protein
MKGVEVAIADAIPPVCPEDDRPAVKDLIQEHRAKIDKITEAVKDHPLYDPNKHDDLWILRFWLSHKKTKAAIDAAKYTLQFRQEHHLDDKDIRDTAPHRVKEGKVHEYISAWKEDDIVVEKFDESYWLASMSYCTEWAFQWLDYVTRTTGRLTKSIRLIDTAGFAMGDFNRECTRRDGKYMG